jgi:AraC-like DNA-binding protein
MNKVLKIDSIEKLNNLFGNQETTNPLVSIIDFSTIADYQNITGTKIYFELYSVMLKQQCNDTFNYGRSSFDFQNGTLIFVAPGQVIEIEDRIERTKNKDWGLFFHSDLLFGSKLNTAIKDYTFFDYSNNEALHLSQKEKEKLNKIIKNLEDEISDKIDKHSQKLIVSNIELLLNYCTRYFDRQFITRTKINHNTLSKLESLLSTYFKSGHSIQNGLPTVKYIAKELHLSPNYLSDLLKKETGLTTLEHIHKALTTEAKRRLLIPEQSISAVAYDLGFEYPQYFTRLFKKQTGMTPKEFMNLN